jgi:hypothetical protein
MGENGLCGGESDIDEEVVFDEIVGTYECRPQGTRIARVKHRKDKPDVTRPKRMHDVAIHALDFTRDLKEAGYAE